MSKVDCCILVNSILGLLFGEFELSKNGTKLKKSVVLHCKNIKDSPHFIPSSLVVNRHPTLYPLTTCGESLSISTQAISTLYPHPTLYLLTTCGESLSISIQAILHFIPSPLVVNRYPLPSKPSYTLSPHHLW